MTGDAPDERLAQARALHRAGRHAEAAAICEAHLRADPADADAHVLLGDAYRALARPNVAAGAYETALTYAPTHLAAHLGIAEIMTEKGWLQSATVVMENAAAVAPGDAAIRARLDMLRARIADLADRPADTAG